MGLHIAFRSTSRLLTLVAVVLLAVSGISPCQSGDAPSLGDLARKQRKKQQSKDASPKAKKVVSDEDFAQHSEASGDSGGDNLPPVEGPHKEAALPRRASDVLQAGEHWRAAISRQKGLIANLKDRIDKLNSSIRFVTASAYRNGVEYNKYQAQKQQEVQRLQSELDEQNRQLEQMQESARQAGYGSAVWDP